MPRLYVHYVCSRCGYDSTRKPDVERHCDKVRPCPPVVADVKATSLSVWTRRTKNNPDAEPPSPSIQGTANNHVTNIYNNFNQYVQPQNNAYTLSTMNIGPALQRPHARTGIPKTVRVTLWNRTFGERNGVGHCHCCMREITQQNFECGHVIAVANGGSDTLDNLRPLCVMCNRSMGTENMDSFIKRTGIGYVDMECDGEQDVQ